MSKCRAIRQSDEMFCAACNLRWDVDDDTPPRCGAASAQPLLQIIGLTGEAGCGKSTAAEYLNLAHQYKRLRFAAPFKNALRSILKSAALDDHTIERMIEGDLKETPHPTLIGKTPRQAMQTLGTEWGRHCIGGEFWVNLTRASIEAIPVDQRRIVIEDVRFENEAKMIRSLGGKIIRIYGRGGIPGGHESEAGVAPDMTCFNGGSVVEMNRWFDYVLDMRSTR